MEILKFTTLIASALLLLPVAPRAQEPRQAELDPEIPWFKVEIIVFRNLDSMPGENEVFTPRPEPRLDAKFFPDGGIDTRMQGTEATGVEDKLPELIPVPEFSDQGGTELDAAGQTDPGLEMAEPSTLEELYFPQGSYFRLVALEELFPDASRSELLETTLDQIGDQSPAPQDTPLKPSARLTESEAARQVQLHELELDDQARRIRQRKNYHLVTHFAWIQPGYAQADAIAFPLAELAGAGSGLKGDITLYLSRYLHMQFDLSISEPGSLPAANPGAARDLSSPITVAALEDRGLAAMPVFRIDEKRRMRSGELHYIDHPNFAALAPVTKVNPAYLPE